MLARPLLAASAVLAALFLAATAHGTGAHGYNGTHARYGSHCAGQATPKGSLTFSDYQFPPTLDIYTAGDNLAAVEQTTLTQDSLWTYNNHAALIPDLAMELPSVSNGGISKDGKSYTIHLKPGIEWSNGQPIDAADIAFSWRVNMKHVTGPYCAGSCDVIAGAEVRNASTVTFRLKHVEGSALATAFTFPIWPRVWKGAWSSNDVTAAAKKLSNGNYDFENTSYPTSGPYQPIKFVAGKRIVYRPNPHYRVMTCGAHLKRLTFTTYSGIGSMIAAAAQHKTDITSDYSNADLHLITPHASAFRYDVIPSLGPQLLAFNDDPTYNGKPNPAHNANVRQALALATDRYAVSTALNGNASLGRNMIAWNFMTTTPGVKAPFADRAIDGVWDPVTKRFTTSPGKGQALADAKRLLAATRWKKGATLVGLTSCGDSTRVAAFKVIKRNWARIGVKLNWSCSNSIFDPWSANGDLAHGRYQVSLHGYFGGSPDPDSWRSDLSYQYCPRRPGHKANDSDGAVDCIDDSLLQREWSIESHNPNTKVRRLAFQKIQLEIAKMGYWQPISYYAQISTYDRHVANFHDNPLGTMDWNAWDWAYTG